jgi:hypothetical protein
MTAATMRSSLPALAIFLASCSGISESALEESGGARRSETVTIASPAEALTFARVDTNGQRRVLLVTRYDTGRVEGIDLSTALGRPIDDPIDVFLAEGYETLAHVVAAASSDARASVRIRDLVTPVDLRGRHVATGLNFPEHAGE